MRFLPAFGLSVLLVVLGFVLQQRQGAPADFVLSINFKALQRLRFDDTTKGRPERVSADLGFNGRALRVRLQVLPHGEALLLPYLAVAVDEREDFAPGQLLLVRADSSLGQRLRQYPRLEILKTGILQVNGRASAEYLLVTSPFAALLAQGLGPFARRVESGVALSPASQEYPVFLKILTEAVAKFPAAVSPRWWYWVPATQSWEEFGEWPEGWFL